MYSPAVRKVDDTNGEKYKVFFTDNKEAGHKSPINLMKILIEYYHQLLFRVEKKYFRLKILMFSYMFKQNSCQKEINMV